MQEHLRRARARVEAVGLGRDGQGGRAMLRDEADSHGSALLTLLVPGEKDMHALTERYIAARQMLAELGMPYLEVRDRLTLEEDYGELDKHWSNAGHGKIADMLGACIEAYFAQGSLKACEGVVAP